MWRSWLGSLGRGLGEIELRLTSLKKKGEGALIGYITAGAPKPSYTFKIAETLVRGGIDILEIGLPFSDPIADGATIQQASFQALKMGTTPKMVLEMVKEVKMRLKVPIALLTYYNPIYRTGLLEFFKLARDSLLDGLIVPDLPVEEAEEYKAHAKAYGIDTIFLASPTTTLQRLRKIISMSSGFLYLVSLFGVTGARERVEDYTVDLIRRFSQHTSGRISLAVGFGISKPEHVRTVIKSGADGAIVGSSLVNIINRNYHDQARMLKELEQYSRALKAATKL